MNLVKGAERLFWLMVWTIVALIAFMFLAGFLRDKNIPVLGGLFNWAEQHAGLEG